MVEIKLSPSAAERTELATPKPLTIYDTRHLTSIERAEFSMKLSG